MIPQKKRPDAQKLINFLLSERGSDGWNMTRKLVIAERELTAICSKTAKVEVDVLGALTAMYEKGRQDVEEFESLLQEPKYSGKEKNASPPQWTFFLPMMMELADDLPKPTCIQIFDRKFDFEPLSSVEQKIGIDPLEGKEVSKIVGSMKQVKIAETYLVANSVGDTWQAAWESLALAFYTLRGVLEFQISVGRWGYSFTRPRARIPHPTWLIAMGPDSPLKGTTFIVDEYEAIPAIKLNNELLEILVKKSSFLANMPPQPSTLSIIAAVFSLYIHALDLRFQHSCFLGLWQALEAITLSEEGGGKTDVVCSRADWHGEQLNLIGSGFRETLGTLAKKRNYIVHQGSDTVEDEDVNILKTICEAALLWLIEVREKLPTKKHLSEFYRLRTINNADLKAVAECAKYVIDQRCLNGKASV